MSFSPQDEIRIKTMVRASVESLLGELKSEKESAEKKINDFQATFLENIKEHVESIGGIAAAKIMRAEFGELVTNIERKVETSKEFFEQINKKTSPVTILNELTRVHQRMVQIENRISKMASDFDFHFTSKFIDHITDEELMQLYIQSGLLLKHIQEEFKVEATTAHSYAHGRIKDIHIRDKLKKFYVTAIRSRVAI